MGPHHLASPLVLAPMAGVADRPFRTLCRQFGAGLAVGEMVLANPRLMDSRKTRHRLDREGEPGPWVVQILGNQPDVMAEAARWHWQAGAAIIDINLGCPAKKVCQQAAGSALLRDEGLVARILEAVVAAVPIPVTLKMRTGWDLGHRNGVTIAQLAEAAGIAALAVHGRTRACGFTGAVEYDTIRAIKQAVAIPVIANGDIDTPERACQVLTFTGVDAIMIGRAALGQPWLFAEIRARLQGLPSPTWAAPVLREAVLAHLEGIFGLYGEDEGIRRARKHLGWYFQRHPEGAMWRARAHRATRRAEQQQLIHDFFTEY
ncbi:tRNA-dihydrouridine synthase B [Gammaproteobacteria bacterium]